jgi:hypothetical protein
MGTPDQFTSEDELLRINLLHEKLSNALNVSSLKHLELYHEAKGVFTNAFSIFDEEPLLKMSNVISFRRWV